MTWSHGSLVDGLPLGTAPDSACAILQCVPLIPRGSWSIPFLHFLDDGESVSFSKLLLLCHVFPQWINQRTTDLWQGLRGTRDSSKGISLVGDPLLAAHRVSTPSL